MQIDPALYQRMAAYNAWITRKVYAAADRMSDLDRKLNRGGFFKSIHVLLNHLLWADRAWMRRFTDRDYKIHEIGVEIHDNYDVLKSEHLEMCIDIETLAKEVSTEWLAGSLNWTSAIDGITRSRPKWLCLTHLFNQQTYHRGQLSTYFTQAGIDMGTTDLISMPDSE
jgi:uncharacterized damage-inducible protein DinB